jgi:hypothetical protein
MVDIRTTNKIFKMLNLNPKIISKRDFHFGFNAEMEHRNITHGDFDITSKIVIAHLEEIPDYYKRLKKLEKKANKEWSNKDKNIYL